MITVLLNDPEPIVVNIMLILILGRISDKIKAAKYAVNTTYSGFLPTVH
jgi:hypothetical protein